MACLTMPPRSSPELSQSSPPTTHARSVGVASSALAAGYRAKWAAGALQGRCGRRSPAYTSHGRSASAVVDHARTRSAAAAMIPGSGSVASSLTSQVEILLPPTWMKVSSGVA